MTLKRRIRIHFIIALVLLCIPILPVHADDLLVPEVESGSIELTIESAIDTGLESNADLIRLGYEVDAALANLDLAGNQYNPTLDFNLRTSSIGPDTALEIDLPGVPAISREITSSEITSTGSLTLTQPVYMFGAIDLGVEAAQVQVDRALLALDREREVVKRDIEEAFLNAALAAELVEISEGSVETSTERLRIAEERYETGDIALFEVLRAEVSLATASDELLQAHNALELAQSALLQKIGLESGTEITVIPPDTSAIEPVQPSATLSELQVLALDNRKDLRSVEASIELLEISESLTRRRPSLVFQGNYSYADRPSGFSEDQDSWGLFLNFSYTLFDGGRTESSLDNLEATREALATGYDNLGSLVMLEVESAYLELNSSIQQIEVSRTALQSAREALRIAELGYSEGVITYIDYQDADLALRAAETMHLRAMYGYLTAESRLITAVGNECLFPGDGVD